MIRVFSSCSFPRFVWPGPEYEVGGSRRQHSRPSRGSDRKWTKNFQMGSETISPFPSRASLQWKTSRRPAGTLAESPPDITSQRIAIATMAGMEANMAATPAAHVSLAMVVRSGTAAAEGSCG